MSWLYQFIEKMNWYTQELALRKAQYLYQSTNTSRPKNYKAWHKILAQRPKSLEAACNFIEHVEYRNEKLEAPLDPAAFCQCCIGDDDEAAIMIAQAAINDGKASCILYVAEQPGQGYYSAVVKNNENSWTIYEFCSGKLQQKEIQSNSLQELAQQAFQPLGNKRVYLLNSFFRYISRII